MSLTHNILFSSLALALVGISQAATTLPGYSKDANGEYMHGQLLDKDQVYRSTLTASPSSLDVSQADNRQASATLKPMFDTLVRLGPDGKYIGAAAESWEVSEDGLVWTFHLRKNAVWHDGKPVTAHDFVYSWRRLNDPKTAATYGLYLDQAFVKNAGKVYKGELPVEELGVKAVDDYTFQVELSAATPWFDTMTSYLVLAPQRKDLIEKYGDNYAAAAQAGELIGNGPFRMTNYRLNDYIAYEKFDQYWNADNVLIKKIRFNIIPDQLTTYNQYLANDVLTATIPAQLLGKVKQERPEEYRIAPTLANFYFGFNVQNVPTPVRKAVQLLVDTKFITSKITNYGIPTSIFTPTNIGDGQLQTEAEYFNQDLATRRQEAIKILTAAGYTKDKPAHLRITYSKAATIDRITTAVEAWLNKGTNGLLELERKVTDGKSFYAEKNQGNYEMVIAGWNADYPQASNFFNNFRCNDPTNDFRYCNPELDKVLLEAQHNADAQARALLYEKANKIIQADAPVVPMYFKQNEAIISPALGGYNEKNFEIYVRDFYLLANKKVKR